MPGMMVGSPGDFSVLSDPYYGQLAGVYGTTWAANKKRADEGQARSVRNAAALQRETGAEWAESSPGGRITYRSGSGGGSGSGSSGGGGGTGTGTVDFAAAMRDIPNYPGARIPGVTDVEDPNLVAQAYGRARDRAGSEGLAAAKSIRSLMARRGLGGSRFAVSQEAGGVKHALNRMGQYNLAEANARTKRASDVADRNYQGSITQRGQDASAQGNRVNQALSLAALRARTSV